MQRCMLVACITLVAVAACGDESTGPGPDVPGAPATLVLSADGVTFTALGQAEHLSATVSDADGIAIGNASVTWSSADEDVATVDGSGRVEAVGGGETEVTASAGDASDAVTVVVTQSAASVSVSPAVSALDALGDSVQYSATVRDANGSVIAGAVVEWTSADTTVATVDAAGWVTAQANGTAVVVASAGDVSDEAAVVIEQVVAAVAVSPTTDTLGYGDTADLTAAIADANGNTVAGRTVVWTTSDPAAATVDAGGRVTGTRWGADAVITATVDGVSDSAAVHLLDQIAFDTNRDGNPELYVMNADGSGATRLTHNSPQDYAPVWSPSGSQIAFRSLRDGNNELYVMNADGTGVVRLTDDVATDDKPSWSPDGSRIAFTSYRDGNAEVYMVNADGTGVTNLTNTGGFDSDAAWSPDGSQILFRTTRDIDSEIYVMNADGSGQTNLTNDEGGDYEATWSPDGTQVAFRSFRDGNREIYVMDADGSNPTNLSNDTGADEEPAWSPDGSQIAFVSNRGDSYGIHVVSASGGPVTPLTTNSVDEARPLWSPDGSMIAFLRDRDGNDEIWVMQADGSGQTNLSDTPDSEAAHAWRPRP